MAKDYYAQLNVPPTATPAEIETAYRHLVRIYHPLVRSNAHALERMREINEAWRVLSDPVRRAAYDQARATGRPFHPPRPDMDLMAGILPARRAHTVTPRLIREWLGRLGLVLLLSGSAAIVAFALMSNPTIQSLLAGLTDNVVGERLALIENPPATPDPTCRAGCAEPPPGCVVKGDVDATGQKFFYLPNDAEYAEIRMNVARGDRWFCNVADAQLQGWTRKPLPPTVTPLPDGAGLVTPHAPRAWTVCGAKAILRSGPGTDYPVIAQVENGARLTAIGANGEWLAITSSEGVLFVEQTALCAPTRMPPRTPKAHPSPTSSPSPAQSLPPVAAYAHPAPQLIAPSHGARYWCSRELTFAWQLNGSATPALAADEWFLVESKAVERERWFAISDWTKETRLALYPLKGSDGCDALWWPNTGVYEWRVTVIRGDIQTHTIIQYTSPPSPSRIVNYGK